MDIPVPQDNDGEDKSGRTTVIQKSHGKTPEKSNVEEKIYKMDKKGNI